MREIARRLEPHGVPMVLVETSQAAAERAAELGLIARDAVPEVAAREARDRERPAPRGPARWLLGASAR